MEAGGGGGSEGMSHRNVAVIRTRGDVGRRTRRGRTSFTPPARPPARLPKTRVAEAAERVWIHYKDHP